MYITIGKIVNTHGIKGEVKAEVYSDPLSRFEQETQVYALPPGLASTDGPAAQRLLFAIEGIRYHKNMALMTLGGVNDLTRAQGLKGYLLQVPAEQLPALPAGRYYIYQLVGLKVWENDVCYGTLTEVLQPGSNDVYVVKEGSREILVPALKTVIISVDLCAGRMEVVLPPGLLELYQ